MSQSPEHPQAIHTVESEKEAGLLPAPEGAKTLKQYIEYRAETMEGEDDLFSMREYQELLKLLTECAPMIQEAGNAGIFELLANIAESLDNDKPFEYAGMTIGVDYRNIVHAGLDLIEQARIDKVPFQAWQKTLPVAEKQTTRQQAPIETTNTETKDATSTESEIRTPTDNRNPDIEFAEPETRSTLDQAADLKRFTDFILDVDGTNHEDVANLLDVLQPLLKELGTMSLSDLFSGIENLLNTGERFTQGGVDISPGQLATVIAALDLLAQLTERADEFADWKKRNPENSASDDEEGYEDEAATTTGAESFIIPAIEAATTDIWKEQTRNIAQAMRNLRNNAVERRINGLPSLFPTDFESLTPQFIYKMDLMNTIAPTSIAAFEATFTELLDYMDLRMLRTAGEYVTDDFAADSVRSLNPARDNLKNIDQQCTILMSLNVSEALRSQLLEIRYRIGLLVSKIEHKITVVESTNDTPANNNSYTAQQTA